MHSTSIQILFFPFQLEVLESLLKSQMKLFYIPSSAINVILATQQFFSFHAEQLNSFRKC